MNFPLLKEYIEAIAEPDDFKTQSSLVPVLTADGKPVFSSGAFAVVFKMRDTLTGECKALKCFLREQERRNESYGLISEELDYVQTPFLTSIKYLEQELYVDAQSTDENWFPVVLMDWVEGVPLDKYVKEKYADRKAMSLLAYNFGRLAEWLLTQPFAHGDLKPDNILVKPDGSLVLVDYDGVFVPAMKGWSARENGSPAFRHPQREQQPFDVTIDDFSLCSIMLSLLSLLQNPSLIKYVGQGDRLLFSEEDYVQISASAAYAEVLSLLADPHIMRVSGLFLYALSEGRLPAGISRAFRMPRSFGMVNPALVAMPKPVTPALGDSAGIETFTVNGVSFKMIKVDGGTFTMGATPEQGGDADDDEKPAHQVTLSDYYIGQTEVTQALWQAVMGDNPSLFKGDSRPVEQVSWNDCQEFIKKLNALTGRKFSLPTEAQWEFAARGGNKSEGYKYAGGDDIGSVAWYYGNSGLRTHDVATKSPNELGLYDMSGNVNEWCSDWYGDYSGAPQTNPTGPASGSLRVRRGSNWNFLAEFSFVSCRDFCIPNYRSDNTGLRLVLLP